MNRCWSCKRALGCWEVWETFWEVDWTRDCPSCNGKNVISERRSGNIILAMVFSSLWVVLSFLAPYLVGRGGKPKDEKGR